VQFINQDIASAPVYDADGAAPSLDVSTVYAGASIEGGIYQNSRAYVQRLGTDLEGSPRLYPADRLPVQWEFRRSADQVLSGAGFDAVILHNSVLGFKLADLISQLGGDSECRIAFSSRSYIIEQFTGAQLAEGRALIRSAGVTMQYASRFVTDFEEGQFFLNVEPIDQLVSANDYQGMRLFAANAPINLYANGTELISSFILNVVDRSLSRSEAILSAPLDSMPIPPPSGWTANYDTSFEDLIF
jgi:hypothetical protein